MTMQEIYPVPAATSSRNTHEALRAATLGPHEFIAEMLDFASARPMPGDEPRRSRQFADTVMATTCRHLAAVDDVLLPVARRRVDKGRQLVTAYLLHTRQLERTLRALKAELYGDANASRLHRSALWVRLRGLLIEHELQETVIVDRLGEVLDDREICDLAERLRRREQRSPTRPHPYSPHTGIAGRVSHRVWSVVDGFWDNAEGRFVPHQPAPRHPRSDSLLTRYMLGAPSFEDSKGAPRAS